MLSFFFWCALIPKMNNTMIFVLPFVGIKPLLILQQTKSMHCLQGILHVNPLGPNRDKSIVHDII